MERGRLLLFSKISQPSGIGAIFSANYEHCIHFTAIAITSACLCSVEEQIVLNTIA